MYDPLIEWLDHPRARAAILFLIAVGLFLNRDWVRPVEDAAPVFEEVSTQAAPEPPRPAPALERRSWRELSAGAPSAPAPDPNAREKLLEHLQRYLVKLGVRSTRMIDMVVAYADRRPWLDAQAEYEAALKARDVPAALAVVRAALAKLPKTNPLLRRDLLEVVLRLQMSAWDVFGAEATFRELLAVQADVSVVWAEELKVNPEVASRCKIDPAALTRAPSPAQVSEMFQQLARRAGDGRRPLSYTEKEWADFEKRMDELKRQGKLDDRLIGAIENWHSRETGGAR
jgi:hypothetical protein